MMQNSYILHLTEDYGKIDTELKFLIILNHILINIYLDRNKKVINLRKIQF